MNITEQATISATFAEFVYEQISSWGDEKKPKRYSGYLGCIVADWCSEWCDNKGYQLTADEIKAVENAAEKELNEYWLSDDE